MRPILPISAPKAAPGAFGYNRAVVKRNYAFMPPEGILDSRLPAFDDTIVKFQTAPVMGARFAQYILEIGSGGGTRKPQRDRLQYFFMVLDGAVDFSCDGTTHALSKGAYAYLPPNSVHEIRNKAEATAKILVLKRPYVRADGFDAPEAIISDIDAVGEINHTGNAGRGWKHLLPVDDMRFDMEMNILSFAPGNYFPAVETHIMEHGLYMLKGQGLYLLENDWHEIWAEDFIWMGSYVPQQFYPTGWEGAAYLLYKDVNRDVTF